MDTLRLPRNLHSIPGQRSSGHRYAEQPRCALATARQQVARLIGAALDEIVFTGSGSEADALAIHGTIVAHRRPSDMQVITQVTEHPAVLEACRALHRRYGTEVTYDHICTPRPA